MSNRTPSFATSSHRDCAALPRRIAPRSESIVERPFVTCREEPPDFDTTTGARLGQPSATGKRGHDLLTLEISSKKPWNICTVLRAGRVTPKKLLSSLMLPCLLTARRAFVIIIFGVVVPRTQTADLLSPYFVVDLLHASFSPECDAGISPVALPLGAQIGVSSIVRSQSGSNHDARRWDAPTLAPLSGAGDFDVADPKWRYHHSAIRALICRAGVEGPRLRLAMACDQTDPTIAHQIKSVGSKCNSILLVSRSRLYRSRPVDCSRVRTSLML
jgi:hypothetical protein